MEGTLQKPLEVEHVSAMRPFQWLEQGMSDMHENLGASLPYGVFFAVVGYLILHLSAYHATLFSAVATGFLLIGPLAAAGCYEISRCQEGGAHCNFSESLRGLSRHSMTLVYYGLFLVLALVSWERLSATLFTTFYHTEIPRAMEFFRHLSRISQHPHFALTYLLVGVCIAALLYCLSVVSVPLMMDRGTNIVDAMGASLRAVWRNPAATAVWALLIFVLIAIGFATYMVGLSLTLPMVGHASWHAYRDLVRAAPPL